MRTLAVMKRILRQFFRDKRTLGLMIVAPMFILTLLHVVLGDQGMEVEIGLTNNTLAERLEEKDINTVVVKDENEGMRFIESGELDAFLQEGELTLEGSDPNKNRAVLQLLQSLQAPTPEGLSPGNLKINYAYGAETMDTMDHTGPFLIAFFIFFFVFLISGVSFLRERTTGTLERLMATPIKRWELVLGYIGGFGIFTLLQSSMIVLYAIYVLDIWMAGTFLSVLMVTFTVAITALTLGTLLSAFARNELQMIQFIPLVVVPQVFFSGLFSMDTMPAWLQKLSLGMPLTYAGAAMKDIMIRGKGIEDIYGNLLMLAVFSLLFILLNIVALKKYRPT